MYVNIECELCSRLTLLHRGKNLAHVAGQARNTEQPRLLIQHGIKFSSPYRTLTHEVSQNSGIYGTGARPHHQAFKWSEPHGRVDAEPLGNRGERTAVTQVTR